MTVAELIVKIAVDASKVNKGIDDTVQKSKSSGVKLEGIFAKVGGAVAGALTAKKVVEFGAACVKAAASAESAFAKVNTLLASDTDTTAYFDSIKKASLETGVAVTDFSEAVYSAISASVDQASAVDFTTNAIKLAKGGFTTAATAVDVLTTAINAYGLKASDATAISDKLVTTQNLGKTTVGELASAMGKVIPTAKSFNVDLDTLCGSYAVMTKNGIATAEATTYLNGMLNELGKSGSTASNVLKNKTGKSFSSLMASGYSLADVLGILQMEAIRTGQSVSDMFGSQEAAKAANTLLSNIEDLTASTEAMRDSAGATETAYAKMSDTISEKVQKLKNRFDLLMESLGEDMSPAIGKFLDGFEKIAPAVEGVADVVGTVLGGALSTVGFVFDAFATGINNVVDPSNDAAEALAGTAETIDDAKAKVAELEATLNDLETVQKSTQKSYAETGQVIANTTPEILQNREALRLAKEQLAELEAQAQAAAEAAADPANRLKEATEDYYTTVNDIVNKTLETYDTIVQNAANWFGTFEKVTDNAVVKVGEMKDGLQSQIEYFQNYTENIKILTEAGATGLIGILSTMGSSGAGVAQSLVDEINAAGGVTSEKTQAMIQDFESLIATRDQAIDEFGASMALGVNDTINQIGQVTESYISEIKEWDKSGDATQSAINTMQGLASGLNSGSGQVMSTLRSIGNQMTSALQSGIGTVYINVEVTGPGAKYATRINGSNKDGLDYVPFDGYISELHKGEAVLTAAEARAWRAGKAVGTSGGGDTESSTGSKGRGMTLIQNIQAVAQTPVELAAATEAYFTQARWAM